MEQIKKRIALIKEIVNIGVWKDGDSEKIYTMDTETEQDFKACVKAMKPGYVYFGLKGSVDKEAVNAAMLTPEKSAGAGVDLSFCPELLIEFPQEVFKSVTRWLCFLYEPYTYNSIAAQELCHMLIHGKVRQVTPVFRGIWLAELLKIPNPSALVSLYFQYRASDEQKWVEYA